MNGGLQLAVGTENRGKSRRSGKKKKRTAQGGERGPHIMSKTPYDTHLNGWQSKNQRGGPDPEDPTKRRHDLPWLETTLLNGFWVPCGGGHSKKGKGKRVGRDQEGREETL